MREKTISKRPMNYSGTKHCRTTLDFKHTPRQRGVLATELQFPHRKLLYTKSTLLLAFNVTLDMFHLNAGFLKDFCVFNDILLFDNKKSGAFTQ